MARMAAVDRFIDDVFNGNVLTYFHSRITPSGEGTQPTILVAISEDETIREKVGEHTKSFGTVIEDYLLEEGHTEENARKLYRDILGLRLYGVFQNNPNNLNELGFYKDRFAESQGRVIDLSDKLKEAYTAIDNLMKRLDSMGLKDKRGEAT